MWFGKIKVYVCPCQQEACKEFDVTPNLNSEDADKMLAAGKAHSYEKGRFRSVAWDKSPVDQDICTCERLCTC